MKPISVSRILALLGLVALPFLFNNCGAGIVMNADGSVAQSTFPHDYESYGSIPSKSINSIPTVDTRFAVSALNGSGLSPTTQTRR